MVVESGANVPWERCARRAVPLVADELLEMSGERGRTPLLRAQHAAAQHRAEEIAEHVDLGALLATLSLPARDVLPERRRHAMRAAVRARSREQVGRLIETALDD